MRHRRNHNPLVQHYLIAKHEITVTICNRSFQQCKPCRIEVTHCTPRHYKPNFADLPYPRDLGQSYPERNNTGFRRDRTAHRSEHPHD